MNSDDTIRRRSSRYERHWFQKIYIYARFCLRENPMGMNEFFEKSIRFHPGLNAIQIMNLAGFPFHEAFEKWREHAGIEDFHAARKALSLKCVAQAAADDRDEREAGLSPEEIIRKRYEDYRQHAAPKGWDGIF